MPVPMPVSIHMPIHMPPAHVYTHVHTILAGPNSDISRDGAKLPEHMVPAMLMPPPNHDIRMPLVPRT